MIYQWKLPRIPFGSHFRIMSQSSILIETGNKLLARGEIEMINVEASTVIHRPIDEVFAFVANFENHPKWEMNFQSVKLLTSSPTGVGTTYQCELKLPGQSATSKFEITEYEVNKKISFEGEAAGPAKPKGSFLLEPVAGGTKLTLLPRPEFRGLFRLLEPMMAGYVRKQNEEHLSNLKRLLET
jgi:uncharacterized membrane protein